MEILPQNDGEVDPLVAKWQNFDALAALEAPTKSERYQFRLFLLETNICANLYDRICALFHFIMATIRDLASERRSPRDTGLRRAIELGDFDNTIFLLSCGAIPTLQMYEDNLTTESSKKYLHGLVAYLTYILSEPGNDEYFHTILTHIIDTDFPTEEMIARSIRGAFSLIDNCASLGFWFCGLLFLLLFVLMSFVPRIDYVTRGIIPVERLFSKLEQLATPAILQRQPLRRPYIPNKAMEFLRACDRNDQKAIISALENNISMNNRTTPGGWSLPEEAVMKGWSEVTGYLKAKYSNPAGVSFALQTNVLVAATESEHTSFCDVRFLFPNEGSTFTIDCHYAILRCRCPLLADEVKIARGEHSARMDPQGVLDALASGQKVELPTFNNTQVESKHKFTILKALIQFCYLGTTRDPAQM